MSGRGAEKMADDYLTDTQPGDRLTQLATQFADAMTEQRALTRAALKAIGMLTHQVEILAGSSKASDKFPESEEDEDEDSDENTRKAVEGFAVLDGDLKGLFDRIAGVRSGSRSSRQSRSAVPPNFNKMVKGKSLDSILSELEEQGATARELIEAESMWVRSAAVAQGRADPSILTRPEAARSARVRELFALEAYPQFGSPSR
jgi:hypothetical protein